MTEPITSPTSTKLLRASIWVAIGALIAAAIVCVVWVLVGDSDGMIGKAFLTILLLAGFAGISILEASLASRRQAWFALASMTTWIVTLLLGAFLIWMPDGGLFFGGLERFTKFLLIIAVLQLALLHAWLYLKALRRYVTTFTSIVTYVTLALVAILGVLLILALMLDEWVVFGDLYWRIVVAIAILAAVGTALVPLVNALFAPKKPRPASPPALAAGGYGSPPIAQPWPTYADGVTPLPVLPDGQPDWTAYYTGQPTSLQGAAAPFPVEPPPLDAPPSPGVAPGAAQAAVAPTPPPVAPAGDPSVQPGYQGYPPPPAPPR